MSQSRSITHPTLALLALSIAFLGVVDALLADDALASVRFIIQDAPPAGSRAVFTLEAGGSPSEPIAVALDAGRANVGELAPGRYGLAVVGASDLSPLVRLELELKARETVRLRLRRRGAGWELAVVDRIRAGEGMLFDSRFLRDVPSNRNVWGLPETVDAVAIGDLMDNGGIYGTAPQRFAAHGTSWTQTSFQFGDLDIGDPDQLGLSLGHADVEFLSAIDLSYGASSADVASPGARLTLLPRRPGSSWKGTAQAHWVPAGLQSEAQDSPPVITRYADWSDTSVTASGPIGSRTGLVLAGRMTRSSRLERDAPTELRSDLVSLSAHLVTRLGDVQELRVVGMAEASSRPYVGRALFPGRDAGQDERFFHLQSTWERRPEGDHTWRFSAGVTRGDFEPESRGPSVATVERLCEGPIPALFEPERRVERLDAKFSFEPDLGGFNRGRHTLRLGAGLTRARATYEPLGPATVAEQFNGSAARVWEIGNTGPSRRHKTDVSVFATDRVDFSDWLSVEAGLRFELTTGSVDGAADGVTWRQLSPRFSGRLRLWDRRLTFLGGWGRYRHRLGLSHLAWGDAMAPGGTVSLWRDANGDRVFQRNERGALVSRVGPGSPDGRLASIDPELAPPRTDEFFLGLEGRISETWSARFIAVHRREEDLLAAVNVGVPTSAYRRLVVTDPGGDLLGTDDDQLLPVFERDPASFGRDRYLLTNPAGLSTLHEGVEFTLQRRFGRRFWLLLGGTASRTEGAPANQGFRVDENDQGALGELFFSPNHETHPRGRLFFDRAYTLSLSAGYRSGSDLRAAFVARYQDGQPFSRLVLADLAQGPTAVRAVPNGRHRFTFTLNVDLRIEKGFRLGERRLALIAEGFNILDMTNEVEEDVVTGPLFRTMTAVQPPRAVRLGLRLDF